MPNIQKKLFILISVLTVIILILAFFVFEDDDKEKGLHNDDGIQTIIENQGNSNLQDDLIDDSNNVNNGIVNNLGNNQENSNNVTNINLSDIVIPYNGSEYNCDSISVKEYSKILSYHQNGNKKVEWLYGCRTFTDYNNEEKDNLEIVRVAENHYNENGIKELEIGYHFPAEESTYGLPRLPDSGLAVWSSSRSSFINADILYYSHIPSDFLFTTEYDNDLIENYEIFHDKNGKISKATLYYDNGSKYSEVFYGEGGDKIKIELYLPNGNQIKAGKQINGAARETEWFDFGARDTKAETERVRYNTDKFYNSDGTKLERQVNRYLGIEGELCAFCVLSGYYEEVFFRSDGSIEKAIEIKKDHKTITFYDTNNGFVRKEIGGYKNNRLEETVRYEDVYSVIQEDFNEKILNASNISQEQKNNAVQNIKSLVAFCDRYKAHYEYWSVSKDTFLGSVYDDRYVVGCSRGPYTDYSAASIDYGNDNIIIESSIYKEWPRINYFELEEDKLEGYIEYIGP